MTDLALSITPVFLIIILGSLLRRIGLPGDDFWLSAARLGCWVLIPSLLFYKLSTADVALPLNLRHDAFGDIVCP